MFFNLDNDPLYDLNRDGHLDAYEKARMYSLWEEASSNNTDDDDFDFEDDDDLDDFDDDDF